MKKAPARRRGLSLKTGLLQCPLQPCKRLLAQNTELRLVNLAVGELTFQRKHNPLKSRFRRRACFQASLHTARTPPVAANLPYHKSDQRKPQQKFHTDLANQ